MPRPCKRRCVSSLPIVRQFGPIDIKPSGIVSMSVEEYETIKLIDLEKLTQEEASKKLDVSRATVQSIYKMAREKLAIALIDAKIIDINGGNYELKGKKCKKGKRCCNENCGCK